MSYQKNKVLLKINKQINKQNTLKTERNDQFFQFLSSNYYYYYYYYYCLVDQYQYLNMFLLIMPMDFYLRPTKPKKIEKRKRN